MTNIWIINSAVSPARGLSVFDEPTRVVQTIKTLDSIDKYCPNDHKFIFDSSPSEPDRKLLSYIVDRENTTFVYLGQLPEVKKFSLSGQRSKAETISFNAFLNWFAKYEHDLETPKRIYKLSGRYELTDDFVPYDPSYDGSFVFASSEESWMSKDKIDSSGASKLFKLRLWHMDYSLLDTFHQSLNKIYTDCEEHGIDIEHSYWKNLHNHPVVEVDKIGVKGLIGPNGAAVED